MAQQIVVDAARLSYMAYMDPHVVQKAFDTPCTADPLIAPVLRRAKCAPIFCKDDRVDSQAYVIEMDTGLWLAFRGTHSATDAVMDLQIEQEPLTAANLATVHTGFLRQFKALESLLDAQVHPYMQSESSRLLYVSGHSAGAAAGTIAAYVYACVYPGRVHHASFGSPRTGNKVFADAYNAAVKLRCRCINGQDAVCKVPFCDGYVHVGIPLWVGKRDYFPQLPFVTGLVDHHCASYVHNVANDSEAPQDSSRRF